MSNEPDGVVDLDTEGLAFEPEGLTKSAFAAQIVFNVLLTVMLFSLFILAFFFVIAAKIERDVVRTSVTTLVQQLADEMKFALTPEQVASVSATVNKLVLPNLQAADEQVKTQNAALLKRSCIILGSAAAGVLVVVVLAYGGMVGATQKRSGGLAKAGKDYPDMKKVLLVTTLGFAAVIVTEFVFLYMVPARYQPLDANKTKCVIIDTLLGLAAPK